MAKSVMLVRPQREVTSYVKKKESGGQLPHPPTFPLKGKGVGGCSPAGSVVEKEENQLNGVLALVDQLSASDRKLLLAKLALRSQTARSDQPRDLDMWVQAVYDELVSTLGAGDGGGIGPQAIKRVLGSPSSWGPVADFMASSKLDKLPVTERQSVFIMLAKLVIKHARYVAGRSGAPLSAKLVGSISVNMASIFDQAFPGYLASGLAPIVARRLVANRETS